MNSDQTTTITDSNEFEKTASEIKRILSHRSQKNNFANLVGIKVTDISLGEAVAEMDVTEQNLNPVNSIHGGCLFTLADVAAGAAASTHGMQITTVDSSFHFLRAGLNTTHLKAHAKELKYGKRLSVYTVTISDQDDVELCESIFTFASLNKPVLSPE